jgi:hypothetical protein
MFEALGCAVWPSPPAPLPPPLIPRMRGLRERGDSGERLWPPIAVDGHCEHLFGLSLKYAQAGAGSSRKCRVF